MADNNANVLLSARPKPYNVKFERTLHPMGNITLESKREIIKNGEALLGIELGSTRIKAVLTAIDGSVLATGAHDWENRFENGVWTYPLQAAEAGVRDSFCKLKAEVTEKYGIKLTRLAAMGISGMMHGYLAFDKAWRLLVPFRTWRNTTTQQAAEELTKEFGFNIPQRWSIAHLYQAILNNEPHLNEVAHITTLAGYIHYRLTGENLLGVGEASGVFPIDSRQNDYNAIMQTQFDKLAYDKGFTQSLSQILPKVLTAGEKAGALTKEGALLLDETGELEHSIPLCPPEGDAGTGMVATNSVGQKTGNVSAGTSVFAMLVLEKPLSSLYTEIDMVTTPDGSPVAMVHCNTCTSELDAWVKLFGEVTALFGEEADKSVLYERLYQKALEGDPDCGGIMAFNYYSGEPITQTDEGRPMVVRKPESKLSLASFMRAQLYSCIATLKLGMDILTENEAITIERLLGHGGLFKTKGVGQRLMAGALNMPVAVMETAGEGGPWGMSILAGYMLHKKPGETLEAYLTNRIFKENAGSCIQPLAEDTEGFKKFMENYKSALEIERAAISSLK